eukprot:4612717-Prymnesium_polylepis.1
MSSAPGAVECDVCDAEYYLRDAATGASSCQPCDSLSGVSCPWNTSLASLVLAPQYWRHSPKTNDSRRCRSSGSWSPCRGGVDPGDEGDGYCEPDYRGPMCEVCRQDDYFFELEDARCEPCGNVVLRSLA